MNSRRVMTILLCLLSFVLASCGSKGGGGGDAKIRIVNVIPDAAAVSVQLDTDPPLVTGLAFGALTQYLSTGGGSREFKVSANNGTSFAIDQTLSVGGGSSYTYIVYNPVASAAGALIFESSLATPNSGMFNFRVINVAAGIGTVDVYLTPAGTDLASTSPNIANAAIGQASSFVGVNAGTYELRITAAGTKDVIYDTPVQTFVNQSSYEAVIFTKGSARLASVAMLNLDENGTGQFNDNLLAEFKVANASQAGSPLNVLVDNSIVLSNIPFAGISNYVTTTAASHTFAIQATATPGANLLVLVANLAAATDTSLALSGPAGGLVPLVLNDNNLPPPALRGRVRFVNVSPNLGALDVYVNFGKQISGLANNAGSSYIEVTADATIGTAYEFDFNLAGTTTPVLKLPAVTIIAGHTYTVYVMGPSNAPQGVVAKDD
jgi:hypothetical protein